MTGSSKGAPLGRRVRILAAAGLSAALLTAPAAAQDSGRMRALMDKIDRLQGELNDLQRAVYRGKVPADPGADQTGEGERDSGKAAGMAPMTQAAGRRLRQRLDNLENELRGLTAQVQQTRHRLDEMTTRLDKLVKDVDYRLKQLETFQRKTAERLAQLEGGTPNSTAGTAAGGSGGDTGSKEGEAGGQGAQTADETAADGQGQGGGTQVLGTVSQQAVADVRRKSTQSARDDGGGSGPTQPSGGEGTQSAAAPGALPDAAPKKQYDAAFDLLQERDFDKAEKALRTFLDKHPEHELAGNAKYWLGETYYVRGKYEKAAMIFSEGFRTYPDSRKAPDNLLKLGITLGELDKVDKACRLFSELQSRFPDAPKTILRRAETEQAELGCSAD